MTLRFNKIGVRKCELNGEPTDVLEVFYSIGSDRGIAQVKDYSEGNRGAILRDLRTAIKKGYSIYKK